MKLALISDLHFRGHRLEELSRHAMECARLINAENPDAVLCAGDVFDKSNVADKDATTGAVVKVARGFFRELQLIGKVKAHTIIGNHDRANDLSNDAIETIQSDVFALRSGGGCEWISLRNLAVLCVSWHYTQDAQDLIARAMLQAPDREQFPKRLLLAHVQVIGEAMNSGQVCEHGTFAVTREFLEALDVDYIRLGDFHRRNPDLIPGKGGYIGALAQKDFGEAGNPQGFEILNTETGESKWVEVEVGRRHFIETVTDEDQISISLSAHDPSLEILRFDCDGFEPARETKLRLRELGIEYKLINRPKTERAARVVEIPANVAIDDVAAFRMYVENQKEKPDADELAQIETALQELTAKNNIPKPEPLVIVSPRLIRTEIFGIAEHEHTLIEWDKIQGNLVSIFGANKAGKTTGYGSFALGMWGRMPGYKKKSVYEMVGSPNGDAKIVNVFQIGEDVYQATRLIFGARTKSQDQKGIILKNGVEITGGDAIRNYNRIVEKLLGTYEMAQATWIMPPDRDGDLTTMDTATARAVVGSYCGCDGFQATSDAAGDAAKDEEARAKELAAQLAGEPDRAAELDIERGKLSESEREETETRAELENLQRELDAANKRLAESELGDAPLLAKIKAHEDAEKRSKELHSRIAELEKEIERLEEKAAGADRAQGEVDWLADLKSKRERLEAQLTAFSKRRGWELERDCLSVKIGSLQDRIRDLRAVPGADEETKATALTIGAVEAEYKEAAAVNQATENRKSRRANDRAGWEARVGTATREIARLRARAGNAPKTPAPPEVCVTCPLMAEFADIPAMIESHERDKDGLAAQIAASEEMDYAETTCPDVADIRKRGELARAAVRSVEAATATANQIEKLNGELELERRRGEVIAGIEPATADDPTTELSEVRKEIESLAGAAERLEAAREAAQLLDDKRARLADMREDYKGACVAESDAFAEAVIAKETLANRSGAIAAQKSAIGILETSVKELDKQIKSHVMAIANCEAQIYLIVARQLETQEKRERLHALELQAKRLRYIQQAFGKKGVQVLIVDSKAIELENIINDFLDRMGAEFSLRIQTQSVNAKSEIVEDFSFCILENGTQRDFDIRNSGEKLMIQIVMRPALQRWLGNASGCHIETIFMDEVFNNLDDSNPGIMVDILKRLAPMTHRIFCISPNLHIADMFESRMNFEKCATGSRIEYVG